MKLYKFGNDKLKLLLYGAAGTGKTRCVGSAELVPALAPSLLVSIGGNPISLRDQEPKPVVLNVDNMADFNVIYDFFVRGQPPDHQLAKFLGCQLPFKTLAIDGATEVQREVFERIVGYKPGRFENLAPSAEISHYRINVDTVGYWIRSFFSLADEENKLPVHVLMTALEQSPALDLRSASAVAAGVKGPGLDRQRYRPAFIGQATPLCESYAYVVGRMVPVDLLTGQILRENKIPWRELEEHFNAALFYNSADWSAKDQYGRLPPVMFDPTMQAIWALIGSPEPEPKPKPEPEPNPSSKGD